MENLHMVLNVFDCGQQKQGEKEQLGKNKVALL